MELGKYVPSTVLSLRLRTVFEIGVYDLFELEDQDWKK